MEEQVRHKFSEKKLVSKSVLRPVIFQCSLQRFLFCMSLMTSRVDLFHVSQNNTCSTIPKQMRI